MILRALIYGLYTVSYTHLSGESQRKDGRYAYKYIDTFGKVQFVYAWKLVPTDKTPAGKRDDISLREKEKEIQKDLDDGIDTIGKKMTVCELYAKQNRHRGNVRHNTTKAVSYTHLACTGNLGFY